MAKPYQNYSYLVNNLLFIENPSCFLRNLKVDGTIANFPEISALIGVPQPMSHHPEGDVFEHTVLTIEKADLLTANLTNPESKTLLMLSALLHDIGKPFSTRYNVIKSNISGGKHNHTGIKAVYSFLKKSGYLYYAEPLEFLVRMHSYPIRNDNLSDSSPKEKELLTILALLRIADRSGRFKINDFIVPKDVIKYFEENKIKMNFYS